MNVAIIMDGNARWAKAHRVPVLQGHRRGAQTLKETVKSAVRLGVKGAEYGTVAIQQHRKREVL